MEKGNIRHGLHAALKEHFASGKPITRLEALVFYGVANLPTAVAGLRKEGWLIKNKSISFAEALRRINEHAVLKTPRDLPTREIQLTEYWVSS